MAHFFFGHDLALEGKARFFEFFASISNKHPFAKWFSYIHCKAVKWWIYHAFPGSAGVEADRQTG